MSCFVSTKDVRINIRIDPEMREKFAILARMQGATTASLIHMFIVQNVHKAERENPEIFAERKEGGKSLKMEMGASLDERPLVQIPFLKSSAQPKEDPKPRITIPKKKEHI